MKADKRYNQWVIENKDGLFYMSNVLNKGWTKDKNQAAYYNYRGAEQKIKDLGIDGLKIIDGVA